MDLFDNPKDDDPEKPNILIIGDSISIGYTHYIRVFLADRFDIYRINENGSHTRFGLERVDEYLKAKDWALVSFNWGLHDLKLNEDTNTRRVPVTEYRENLGKLVKKLKASGARLQWVSTTPIPEGAKRRISGDEIVYNAIAANVMNEAGIQTCDLHAHALTDEAKPFFQRERNVHYTKYGSAFLALKVALCFEARFAE